jgi:hypothetical protein
MIFGCFHSRDSQLDNKCSFCSIKIFFYIQIRPLVWCVMPRNPPERAVTTTQTKIPNYIHNVHRNMSDVFYNQSSGCFKNLFDNISTGTVGFSLGPGVTMAAFLFCAQFTLRAPAFPLTQCSHSRSFFKIKAWNYVWRLLTPWGSDRKRNLVDIPLNGAMGGYGTWSFQHRSHFLVWFFSGSRLQYQFCYTHRQYFDSFGNFRVFPIQY